MTLSFDGYPLFPEGALPSAPERCVSAILPTYNRAPHAPTSPEHDCDPLAACLRTLAEQACSPLLEVVVVDDAGSDHTPELVEHLRPLLEAQGVALIYQRNARRLDAQACRNLAARRARGRLLYMLDDDCVLPPHALAGAVACHQLAAARFPRLAGLALPVYQRATAPLVQLPSARIGLLDRERGEARGAFHAFPSEYAAGLVEHLDAERHHLVPIPVENLCGAHALLDRARMLEVGGFVAFPTRGYGGETGLALALMRAGYELRYAPDPRLHALHLRWGNPRSPELRGDDYRAYLGLPGPTLARLVAHAAEERADTGCRVAPAVWYYARIRNQLRLLAEHEPLCVERYRAYVERSFVRGARLGDVVQPLATRAERERVVRLAVLDAESPPEQSLGELEARLRIPPISAVLLAYQRPANVESIAAGLVRDPLVDDVTVWNNDGAHALPARGALRDVKRIDASENSLLARYAAALLARHEVVLIQDDDVIVPSDTLAELYRRFCADPDVVHGLFGRDPLPDGSYARELNQVDATCDVVLTRCLLVHRRHLAAFFAELGPFGLDAAEPPGNGEDILLGYVVKRATGRKNRVHALPVRELPAPHAIHRRASHRPHRTNLMRRCLRWLASAEGDDRLSRPTPVA